MESWKDVVLIILCIPAIIGGLWAFILMWRNNKALFVINFFIPLFPAIYFYVKYWRKDNVPTALYMQLPALLFILIIVLVS